MKSFAVLIALLLPLVSLSAQESAPARTIIILDASGSMWGVVDGKPKIEIAREAIKGLLETIPPETHLGLITYGHRKKGDCQDIELLIPPKKIDQAAFLAAVEGIVPKGMTPLTDAVILAAETLSYTENKATVILVTDGLETCKKDPCAAAKKLEKAGIDFTTHVIAFDLTAEDAKKIACIAEDTGGQFLPAQDAGTLQDALDLSVEEATTQNDEKDESSPAEEATATLKVPAEAPAGSTVEVEWTGPNGKGDYLTIVPKDAGDRHYKNYVYTRDGSPSKLRTLIKPQEAEIRYRSAKFGKILARATIRLTEVKATLKAPESVVAGTTVKIEWTGPAYKGDYITIVTADTEDGKYAKYAYTQDPDAPVKVLSPIKSGKAEIRYMTGQGNKVLARRAITLTPAEVMLEAPDSVVAGATVKVIWTGPNNRDDYITIVTADTEDGKYGKYAYTRDPDAPAMVISPIKPGKAEIRYMSSQGNKVLARRPITLTKPEITLEAPESVVAGATVKVIWTGPNNKDDYITIVTADTEDGKYAKYAYTRDPEKPAKVLSPIKPGKAEIRYMAGQGAKVLARRAIELTAPVVTLEAPDSAVTGTKVTVKWTGPANNGDYITIVTADTKDGKYSKYAYARDPEKPVKVLAGIKPGKAEIRYMTGQGAKVLARRPITITAAASA